MRVILEKKDILDMIGKVYHATVTDEDVVIRTDPLEIELRNLRDPSLTAPPAPEAQPALPANTEPVDITGTSERSDKPWVPGEDWKSELGPPLPASELKKFDD